MRVLVLGHRYTVHNETLNNGVNTGLMDLGLYPLAKEHLLADPTPLNILAETGIDVDLWFSEGAEIYRAARMAVEDPEISGVVYLSMFNCGFDAAMEDVLRRRVVKGTGTPYLHLKLDEHSSKANLSTRLEVFADILYGHAKAVVS
jgi:predicted nucleotide-binding protein (sugar kinase/HSP70/actin superfamily)